MKYIPFPPDIAAQSAERTRESYNKSKGKKPASHATENALCYMMPNGALRQVYDPYKAEYPEGCIPGYGTVHAHLSYYANDTHGYEYSVTNFIPLAA